jgi:hypothetical protein
MTGHFVVMGFDRDGRSLRLSRFRVLILCGSAAAAFSDADARQIRTCPDAKQTVIVRVGSIAAFTPAGEIRHPAIRAWYHG